MKVRRVALIGYYGRGNFGDDLMAVIFGRFIEQQGADLRVYKLCEPYSRRFGFEVVHTPEQLLEGADLLVSGGGGSLVPWRGFVCRKLHPKATKGNLPVLNEAERRGMVHGGLASPTRGPFLRVRVVVPRSATIRPHETSHECR